MSQAALAQITERPLPHSAEAERAILGAIILDNGLVNQAIELLRPDDFYIRANQFVFRSMISLSERGAEINPILLGEELRREGVLEQVGGISYVSELTYGLPHFTNVAAYAKVVHDKSTLRQIIRLSNKITSEALEDADEPRAILASLKEAAAAIDGECSRSDGRPSLMRPFSEFMRANFVDGEEIAFHSRRGELVLVQSVTNHGKSTLIRNVSLTLAVGGTFAPVVERAGSPLRVLLLNFEGSGGWFQNDLAVMTRDFTHTEIELLNTNFYAEHAPMLDGEPLSLSRHMRTLENDVRRAGGVDVLVIDTVSAAFSLRNENDNAEVANHVMKPLMRLARRLNCLIVLVHHIGKAKAEEGATREQAHRGRGASAWADFSTSIFNLEADAGDQTRVTLTCGKRKDGPRYERVLRLDAGSRWLRTSDEQTTKPVTNEDLVVEALEKLGGGMVATHELERELAGRVKRTTVMNCLRRLQDGGRVASPRRGWWSLIRACPTCHALLVGVTSCTKCDGGEKSSPMLALAAGAGASPNGNGRLSPEAAEHRVWEGYE